MNVISNNISVNVINVVSNFGVISASHSEVMEFSLPKLLQILQLTQTEVKTNPASAECNKAFITCNKLVLVSDSVRMSFYRKLTLMCVFCQYQPEAAEQKR